MEQATATGAFPIERVREQFPLLAREVNGVPVAYLDSGASSERVLASIEAVAGYARPPPPRARAAPPRGGGATPRPPPHRRRRPPRGRLRPQRDRGAEPRRPRL